MADFFLSNLKSTLDNCITELDEIHSMFCRNPESDFTRNRKLSFREYIQFMLQMQSKSVSNAVNICRGHISKHDGNEKESVLLIQRNNRRYLSREYNRKYPYPPPDPKRNRDSMYRVALNLVTNIPLHFHKADKAIWSFLSSKPYPKMTFRWIYFLSKILLKLTKETP